MHTIKLKNFNISVNEDSGNIIAVQSGKPLNGNFDQNLLELFELKIQGFLDRVREYIPLTAGAQVLDIGSGNSLFDIALALDYPDLGLNFVLVDGNDFNTTVNQNTIHTGDYEPYNSWAPVFDNIRLNGLDTTKFKTVDPTAEYWTEPGSCDIVMTTSSWGWHYPVETYLERAYNLLKPGGYLIIRPLLNINNYLETVNALFGEPLYLNSFPFKIINGIVKSSEENHWLNVIKPTGPDHIMFYHAIWKKPQTA